MKTALGCRVLAFARGWTPEAALDLRRVRGHLRGLGAELVVVADGGTWRCRPDDELEQLDDRGDLAREYGICTEDAVFVVDTDGIIRFTHRQPVLSHDLLVSALDAASDAVLYRAPVMFTRRSWLTTCMVTGFTAVVLASCRRRDGAPPAVVQPLAETELDVTLDVNGRRRTIRIEPRVSLLDALRERLNLPGTKKGCDGGQCGSCTVLVGGKRVVSCLTLAAMAQGKPITTIEGLAQGDALHPVQKAFVEHDGFQCGFCTSGQIMSAVALLQEGRATTADEVCEHMSGNLCRCGAYPNIIDAIQAARGVKT